MSSRLSMTMPPVGKSGPMMNCTSFSTLAPGVLIKCRAASQISATLWGGIDVAILDGEAQPTGGMGLARQFKFELDDCPPIIVLIARPQDGWLASWSLADAVIHTPIEPLESAAAVAEQLRRRVTGIPVVR